MRSEKFKTGDEAVLKIALDLTKKGYVILTPLTEQHPFDLVVYSEKDNKFLKLQVKSTKRNSAWLRRMKYKISDFDFYAFYMSGLNKIIYPPSKLMGRNISFNVDKTGREFYWWEDFIDFKFVEPVVKTYKDLNVSLDSLDSNHHGKGTEKFSMRKVKRPSKDELENLIKTTSFYSLSKKFGVTDNSIRKWCRFYGIDYKSMSPFTK